MNQTAQDAEVLHAIPAAPGTEPPEQERLHYVVTEDTFNRKGFWSLVVTQIQGAFNDNLYQYTIIFFLLGMYSQSVEAGNIPSIFGFRIDRNVENIATFLFSMPFIIFPALFGAIADKVSKQRLALFTKYWEIAIMILGGVALYLGNPLMLWIILFLMATQSAMFSPAKYGILPEILPEPRLSWANGIVQMTTIIAIIAGIGVAGPLFGYLESRYDGAVYHTAYLLVALSMLGTFTAHFITRPPAANPATVIPRNPLNPWAGMGRYFRAIRDDKVLMNVVIGYTFFWFAGAATRNTVLSYWTRSLGLSFTTASYMIAAMSIGIGIGALVAGFLSRRKIELGLVPIGVAGLVLFCGLLAVPANFWLSLFDAPEALTAALAAGQPMDPSLVPTPFYVFLLLAVVGLGASAGVFDVPLAASIQQRAPHSIKGGVIAATNMLTFVGMAVSSLVLIGLTMAGFTAYGIFAVLALISVGVGTAISTQLPHLILRAVLWVMANTIYRVKTLGRENIPEQGGALFFGNHMSLVDALAMYQSTDRQIRFMAARDVLDTPWMRRVANSSKMILFDPSDELSIEQAVSEARSAIRDGWVVAVSTDLPRRPDGSHLLFLEHPEILIEGLNAPLVPVHVDRLWGRLYEFTNGRLKIKRPPRIPYAIQVNYGVPLPQNASLGEVNLALQLLGVDSYTRREPPFDLLHRGFLRAAKRNLKRRAIVDLVSGELNYMKLLAGSIVFARKLDKILDDREMVGVLLPPSVGGVLTNVALDLLGRVPVNLNYTASNDALKSCAQQCNISQVLTSRKFLERLSSLEVPANAVFVDDIRETVKGSDRIVALLMGLLLPVRLLERVLGTRKRTLDDIATVVFSSGSEGDPKGVMLTQRNLILNIEQALQVFPHDHHTSVVGYLPFFHSFGFMATLWMPICEGIHALYHPNPLEPKVIGQLVEKHGGSIMIGTSTFLQNFIRRCTPEQLKSLDFVVTGAEKLAPRVRTAFKEKFGVEPLEGYGTTECAPAVSVNFPDLVSPGFHFIGTRHGTIGRPLPGQAVRVVDPDTGALLPSNEPGLLQVKGPNIMKGYLHQPQKTAEVLQDGWYSTGDIAALAPDGFITITDRLARFSKIGGEMVPHIKIEEALHDLLALTEQTLAIASVPDTQKGERLVVLHTLSDEQFESLIEKLDELDLPNLWVPRPGNFYRIEQIPVLATGKMDIKAVKTMARSLDIGE